jgi:hypothetical protein
VRQRKGRDGIDKDNTDRQKDPEREREKYRDKTDKHKQADRERERVRRR